MIQNILKKTLDNKALTKFGVETTSFLHKYTKKQFIKKEKDCYEGRIMQQEKDQLSGKLFVDYLSSLKRNIIIKKVKKLKNS